MSQFRLQAGSMTLIANCADELQQQASWLLAAIKKLHEQGMPLDDGRRIQFGWAVLTLKRRGGGIVLCEPNYAENPFSEIVEEVTRTLWVQAQQADVLRNLGLAGLPAMFQDKIVVAKGCLDEPRVFLQRQDTTEPRHAGWFSGRVKESQPKGEDYDGIFVYQLLFVRPALMEAIALPAGYIVVFDGNRIESILDPQDRPVWHPK